MNQKKYYEKLKEDLIELIEQKKDKKELKFITILIPTIILLVSVAFMIFAGTIVADTTYLIAKILIFSLTITDFSVVMSIAVMVLKEMHKNQKSEKEIDKLIDDKVKEIEKALLKDNAYQIKKTIENNFISEEYFYINELKEYKKIINDLINKYDDMKEKPTVKVLKKDNKNT